MLFRNPIADGRKPHAAYLCRSAASPGQWSCRSCSQPTGRLSCLKPRQPAHWCCSCWRGNGRSHLCPNHRFQQKPQTGCRAIPLSQWQSAGQFTGLTTSLRRAKLYCNTKCHDFRQQNRQSDRRQSNEDVRSGLHNQRARSHGTSTCPCHCCPRHSAQTHMQGPTQQQKESRWVREGVTCSAHAPEVAYSPAELQSKPHLPRS